MPDERPKTPADDFRARALRGIHNTFWGLLLLQLTVMVEIVRYVRAAHGTGRLMGTLLVPMMLASFILTAYVFYIYRHLTEDSPAGREAPDTDSRTGAFTMQYLASNLDHERRRAEQQGVVATVAYLDTVNLQRVNRAFGHTVGDIVLRALVQAIGNTIRGGDVLARAGGDEFVILMPETTLPEARAVLEQVRRQVQDYRLDLGKKGVIDFLDLRWGVAAFPADGETPEDIVSAAREDMFKTVTAG